MIEDSFQGIVFLFWTFVDLIQYFGTNLLENREQNVTYLELHADKLDFFDGKQLCLDTLLTEIFDVLNESYQLPKNKIYMQQFISLHIFFHFFYWLSELFIELWKDFESGKNEKDLTFCFFVYLHDSESIFTVSCDNFNIVTDERIYFSIYQVHRVLLGHFCINFSLFKIFWPLNLDQTFVFQVFTCSCTTSLWTSSTWDWNLMRIEIFNKILLKKIGDFQIVIIQNLSERVGPLSSWNLCGRIGWNGWYRILLNFPKTGKER